MREHDPYYAGTHLALALVAAHNGDTKTAVAERLQAETLWKNADRDVLEAARR